MIIKDKSFIKDMDLIEILWKQDVDMGFSLEESQALQNQLSSDPTQEKIGYSKITKESADPEIKKETDNDEKEAEPWPAKSYTIDLETGEYILKEERSNSPSEELSEDEPPSALLPDPDFSLEEALELIGLNDGIEGLLDRDGAGDEPNETGEEVIDEEIEAVTNQLQQELDIFTDMIQTPSYHPRHYQGRVGYSRTVSMEQRWQDLASLLSLPESQHYPHNLHHHHHNHHHPMSPYHHGSDTKTMAHPPNPTGPESQPHYSSSLGTNNNVGSAVASSMNLMTNSSEPMVNEAAGVTFKMENNNDMMYYQQNGTTEMNHNSTEGFLSSILNDEDLQLMDMAMNEGLYTMRMLEGATGGSNTAGGDSDSAVSSMGSERVPSLTSDTEWMETNSDSGHTPADHYPSDYSSSAFSKYRWYDYGCSRQLSGESSRGQPVAQKKHHMYGKRVFHEQTPNSTVNGACLPLKSEGNTAPAVLPPHVSPYQSPPLDVVRNVSQPELKYSCSVEFSRQNLVPHGGLRSNPAQIAAHNHTYHILPESCGMQQRPLTRDKKSKKSEEEQHLSRDERRARSLNIPMAVDDIINLPMDEFNERLSKYDLSENQLSLIRDIRRRGKNKVAAQNCRKRKLDQILSLADEVRQMKERKQRLLHERQVLLSESNRIKSKFSQLYRHIFQSLRDADGNPYSPYEWSLQQTADGSVIVVPRGNQTMLDQTDPLPTRKPHDHQRTP
ncbi:segmentation protein cap'n'collar isoform X3 [Cimex lectularius]|uniref:BZIP domain-containing protein n=1 Tax=Cimex lectularius TaxID=79782 RepID=A0A8I6SLZ4_CIMLE|nr:segmentation protein cap'n'collar isoform X3 [Cimex lectularius]